MGGRVRWAVFVALLSVVLAVGVGLAARSYSDGVVATVELPIEGSYAFASTTLIPTVATQTNGQTQLVVTGGRLSIGGDGHVFWSLTLHSQRDASRSGRLSCEGSFDRGKRAVVPSPRYGYNDFAPDLDRIEMRTLLSNLFCSGAGFEGTDVGPVEVEVKGGLLQLVGRSGSTSWRRE
jgi:hypothetical protein